MKELLKIFKSGREITRDSGQVVLYQGETTDNVFYVLSGYIKVYDIDNEGNEKLLLILGPGDMFPIIWSLKGKRDLLYFYETIESSKILITPKKLLLNKSSRNALLANELLKFSVNLSVLLMTRIKSLEATDSKQKVLEAIIYLYRNHSKKSGEKASIKPPVTHKNIADLCGITRETASLQIKKLELEGLLTQSSQNLIVYPKKLNKYKLG